MPETQRPAAPAAPPDPRQGPACVTAPSETGLLIVLLRKLIDYGKDLVSAVQQCTAFADLPINAQYFHTGDIGLIVAQITRGLMRAAALRAWLITRGTLPPRRAFPSPLLPRPPRTAAPIPRRPRDVVSLLDRMPTEAEIAAEVRRRPVGATIADICRDLAILPSHPLWRELELFIIRHDGSLARLESDVFERITGEAAMERRILGLAVVPRETSDALWGRQVVPSIEAGGTGPP